MLAISTMKIVAVIVAVAAGSFVLGVGFTWEWLRSRLIPAHIVREARRPPAHKFDMPPFEDRFSHWEMLTDPLYDSAPYPEAGGDVEFFMVPVGQRTADGGKLFSDTNMLLSHQLPAGQAFVIKKIQVHLAGDGDASHKRLFLSAGDLRLFIGSKTFTQRAPLGQLDWTSEGKFLVFDFLAGELKFSTHEGERDLGTLSPADLRLEEHQNFSVTLRDLPPMKSPGRIFVHLHGELYRRLA